ncbi:MAG: GTP-binding protein [Nanoarchaeota archaeon]
MKTPITIITGYLGAGKTTLLRNILDNADQKLAVIMNEFGEINIDGKILKGKNIDMVELQGGCVCCSLTGEFEAAVKEIIEKAKPDAIVVETTGVAEPDAVVVDIQDNLPELRLDAVITVADADAIMRFPTIGHTGKMQLEIADIILLNKIDLVEEAQLKEVENKIKSINKNAIIFKTKKCSIDNEYLFGINTKKTAKKHKTHELKENYFYFETKNIIDGEKFKNFIKNMPKNIYRAKGFIKSNNGDLLFNYVAGRHDFEEFKAENTELVFIGESIDKVKDSILKELEKTQI